MPDYLHPSTSSTITDRSFTFATAQGLTNAFFAFFSDQGEDNVLRNVTSPEEYDYYYGAPNYRVGGQQQLNIKRWLRSSGGAFCMRLTADDATFAVSVPDFKTKIETTMVDGVEVKTLKVKPSELTLQLPAITADSIENEIKAIIADDATRIDANGFKSNPLFFVKPRGRGNFYNKRAYRVTPMDSLDDTYGFRTFTFEFLERQDNGAVLSVSSPYNVSIDPDSISINNESMALSDIVEKYDNQHDVVFIEEVYDDLADELGVNPALIDWISGSPRIVNGTEVDPFTDSQFDVVEWVLDEADSVNFTSAVYLKNGSNGDTSLATKKSLLVKAYNGEIDPSITDKRQVELDVVLDANFDSDVKNAIGNFVDNRGDCIAILDTGLTGNFQQAIDYRRNTISMNSRSVAIFTQDMVVYDEYSGKNIKVTPTYFIADKLPRNDDDFGIHVPFVGPRRGAISGFKSISWLPTEPQKEQLYKAQVNYIEQDTRQTKFATQLTAQVNMSALSNLSMVRSLYRIVREAEKIVEDYPYEFNDADTHADMQSTLNSNLQKWVSNRALEYITFSVYASDYDKQQKVVRVRIDLKFNGIIERVLMDFVVNK